MRGARSFCLIVLSAVFLVEASSDDKDLQTYLEEYYKSDGFSKMPGVSVDSSIQEALNFTYSCDDLENEIAVMKNEILRKDIRVGKLRDLVAVLMEENDDLEQYTLRNNLIISGLKQDSGENVVNKVLKLFNKKLGIDELIVEDDIVKAKRTGKADPKDILVKLATREVQRRILDLRNGIGKSSSISLREDLTAPRSLLLSYANEARDSGYVHESWSNNGRIMVKDFAGEIHILESVADLYDLLPAFASDPN